MNIESRINTLIESINTKGLFVLKGFNNLFKLDYCKINYNRIIDVDIISLINNNENLDIAQLMLRFSQLSNCEDKFIIEYETFLLIDKNIINLLNSMSFPIHIINNNLFFRYYPIMDRISREMLKEIDNNTADKTINNIYSEYNVIDGKISVLFSELNVDFDIPNYNLFSDKCEFSYTDGQGAIQYTFNDDESVLCSNILHIMENHSNSIVCYLDNCSKSYLVEKLKLILGIGITFKVSNKKVETLDIDYSELEEILHRRNKDYSFRKFKIYDNPGISTSQIEISQGQVINSILTNVEKAQEGSSTYNDIFLTAPTGAGKSVMFQIPAIHIAEKYSLLTIVLTPLIGLMNDQVDKIKDLTDCAATINSDYTPAEKEIILNQIKNGEKSILYISPETLLSNGDITSLIGDRKIGLMVIDEAHTVATWGKSFRPDYWYLGDYINFLRTKKDHRFPIATFSATITYGGDDNMYYDVIESLKMRPIDSSVFIGSVRRDDISFDIDTHETDIDYRSEKENIVVKSLTELNTEGKKVIAYFPFKRHINDIKSKLPKDVISSRYHGALDKVEKQETIEKFKDNTSKLVLATKAFGMGIDIDDVDVVYHYAPTGNLCDYVQEIGRAARKETIDGIAKVDFFDSDFNFIKQLHGMSRIRNSQIIEVLNKIKNLYYVKRSRNFTVSPDEFSYIFTNNDADSVDSSLKTTLLMIQKDFELDSSINYKPLVFKPRSLFTKGYFLIKDDDIQQFKNGLTIKYSKLYATKDSLTTYANGTKTTFMGDVYTVDFRSMWEDNYRELSFPQFKRAFFTGELENCEDTTKYIPKYIVTIEADETFSETFKKCMQIVDALKEIINDITAQNKHFTVKEFSDELYKKCSNHLTQTSAIIATNNVITILNNMTENSFHGRRVIDYNHTTDKYSIRSKAAIDNAISMFNKELYKSFNQAWDSSRKTFLVSLNKNTSNNDIVLDKKVLVAQFLEAFSLAKYDVRSGERPEFFIRVNSIKAIEKILNNSCYKSPMVELVNKRHLDSVNMMTYFFKELKTDVERWDYIEKYFVASDSL